MTAAQPVVRGLPANKLCYVQYTDDTIEQKSKLDPGLGILGTVLRAVVGEFIEVTFFNRTTQPLSMHPRGVRYDKDSEGAYYLPKPGLGAAVGTNATFTYVWQLNEKSGPSSSEPSSKAWLYHSHMSGDGEANLGLIGFIIVTDPQRARFDGTPADVDRELATLFMIFDESGLVGLNKEALERGKGPGGQHIRSKAQMDELIERGARYAINGRVFCNLSGLEMNEGEHVRWYLFPLGSEQDFHTPHWHGVDVVEEGRRGTDVVELLPATMKVADMEADNSGTWLFHCHVAEHMQHGMAARFVIYPRNGSGRAPIEAFLAWHKRVNRCKGNSKMPRRLWDSVAQNPTGHSTVRLTDRNLA